MQTPHAILLGTAQDGGFPHAGCRCAHCSAARSVPSLARTVVSLGLVDGAGHGILIDASPDLREQVLALPDLSRILLTHAHMGHVAGLLWLGREAMAVRGVPLGVGRRMRSHLAGNEPWASLFMDGHLLPEVLPVGEESTIGEGLTAEAIPVPHRAEWSETFAFRIRGPNHTLLWLPDIDGWEDDLLAAWLDGVDYAFLDATFWSADELPGRDRSEIPHPLVPATIAALARIRPPAAVSMIHLNHSNPLVDPGSPEARELARLFAAAGLRPAGPTPVAADGLSLPL